MKKTLILCSCLFITMIFTQKADAEFYISSGNNNLIVSNEDPNHFKAVEWQVRLFKKITSSGGVYTGESQKREQWGLLTDKTAAGVMKQLKDAQEFERKYDRFFHTTDNSPYSYSNSEALGPIAIVKKPEQIKEVANEVSDISEQFQRINKLRQNINQVLTNKAQDKNIFANAGNVLKEYADNFKDVFEKQEKLRNILAGIPYDAADAIETNKLFSNTSFNSSTLQILKNGKKLDDLDKLAKELDEIEKIIAEIKKKLEPYEDKKNQNIDQKIKNGLRVIYTSSPH